MVLGVMTVLILQVMTFISAPASALEVVYVINSESVDVYISPDGSADINYNIQLMVRPQSSYVSTLTIHLPNWRFDIAEMSVTLDGRPVTDLKKVGSSESDLKIAFNPAEVLQPGTAHTISIVVNVGAMVLKHPSNSALGRITFTPTWWNPLSVQSIQNLDIRIHLPEGYNKTAKVHSTSGAIVGEHGNRIFLAWNFTDVPADQKHTIRVDFPASWVSKVYDPFWDIQFHFYQNYLYIIVVVVIVAAVVVVARRAFRKPYVKPYLNVEGWGERAGFGPMEAASLLDLDHARVAAMFLLDLAMVDAIEIKDPVTMAIEVKNPEHEGRSAQFLGCIRDGRLSPIATTNYLGSLKDDVLSRLEDFDLSQTKAHYAQEGPAHWSRFKTVKAPTVDDVLWLMTDQKAAKRFKETQFEGVPDWTSWKVVL
jgi:hypothetical protein